MYRRHSQYMGGLKETNLSKLREKNPTRILEHAVLGMLPKNKHQSDMIARLRLVIGADHQYAAQKPESISL
jgi:large subunit ribosomal protein L13